jgi:single-stranded DNA-specific DHH superfamily exonuclease
MFTRDDVFNPDGALLKRIERENKKRKSTLRSIMFQCAQLGQALESEILLKLSPDRLKRKILKRIAKRLMKPSAFYNFGMIGISLEDVQGIVVLKGDGKTRKTVITFNEGVSILVYGSHTEACRLSDEFAAYVSERGETQIVIGGPTPVTIAH